MTGTPNEIFGNFPEPKGAPAWNWLRKCHGVSQDKPVIPNEPRRITLADAPDYFDGAEYGPGREAVLPESISREAWHELAH